MALFGKKKKTEDKVEEKEVKATKKVAAKSETKTKKAPVKKVSAKKETKKETTESVTAVKAKKEDVVATGKSDYAYRITEKATRLADKNVYVLNVPKTINKTQLKFDLEKKYKVTVLDINISNTPKKNKMFRGHWGTRGGGKKAYITLKAGDSIVL
jgi:large subunit ribosomal protein L23